MDLSKAFDAINHGLLPAETKGIWFLKTSTKFHA